MAKGSVRKKGKKWYYRFYVEKAKEKLKDTYFEEDGSLKPGKTQEAYDAAVAKQKRNGKAVEAGNGGL